MKTKLLLLLFLLAICNTAPAIISEIRFTNNSSVILYADITIGGSAVPETSPDFSQYLEPDGYWIQNGFAFDMAVSYRWRDDSNTNDWSEFAGDSTSDERIGWMTAYGDSFPLGQSFGLVEAIPEPATLTFFWAGFILLIGWGVFGYQLKMTKRIAGHTAND